MPEEEAEEEEEEEEEKNIRPLGDPVAGSKKSGCRRRPREAWWCGKAGEVELRNVSGREWGASEEGATARAATRARPRERRIENIAVEPELWRGEQEL